MCTARVSDPSASGGFLTNHVHSRGRISASYCVAAPQAAAQSQAGWIKVGEPDLPLGLAARSTKQALAGRMALFPSSFWHSTVPLEDTALRLTIAFRVKRGAQPT